MARPFGWVVALGIVYASLYPFEGWRDSGWQLSDWFFSPWPKYWTQRDLWLNWLGYLPLGFLWGWRLLRARRQAQRLVWATIQASLLSLVLEALQGFLDSRVSSNVDWAFNTLGGFSGAVLAWFFSAPHRVKTWQSVRSQWMSPNSGPEWVLLVLWVLALFVPSALPFAIGRWPADAWLHVLQSWWPFTSSANWDKGWVLSDHQESALIAVTLLSPMGLIHLAVQGRLNKWVMGMGLLAVSVLALTAVSALTHGLDHAGTWLSTSTPLALGLAVLLGAGLLALPRKWGVPAGLLVLLAHAVGVNIFAHSGYWDMEWQTFNQGRTARVNGVLSWIALAWPWVVMALLALRIRQRPRG